MRTSWTILAAGVLSVLFSAPSYSQNRTAERSAEAAVREILASQQKAWNEGNVDAFMLGYWQSEELTFSGSGGITRGYAGLRERYKKSYPDHATMGILEFSGLEVRTLGADAALALGHWHLAREKGDVGGVFSLVFQRFPDGWKIIHDHTSAVPQPDGNPKH